MRNVVLVPAYKPDRELVKLIEELNKEELSVLVVDDGSGEQYADIFDLVSQKAVVIHSPSNQGKGGALKSGIRAIRKYFPDCTGFVTADADGQHKTSDILRVCECLNNGASMVLTMRQFDKNMPVRSRVGNVLSRWIYTILTGHYLADNQSGLRGFAIEHADWLLNVPGEKYDYEINVILYADKQHIRIKELPIEAVYIDGNKSSHFSPVADTLRIYFRLFSGARGSVAAVILAEILMIVVSITLGYRQSVLSVPAVGIICALFSIILSRYIFRKVDYKDTGRTLLYTAIRYSVYTEWCFRAGMFVPKVPIVLSFNLAVLICIPLKYLVHKYIRRRT